MDLGLSGRRLRIVTVEFTAILEFTDEFELTLESPFTMVSGSTGIRLSPQHYLDANFDRLRRLVGTVAVASGCDDFGNLEVVFAEGSRIIACPDAKFEAWSLVGPDEFRVVCLPSGGLATWAPRIRRS